MVLAGACCRRRGRPIARSQVHFHPTTSHLHFPSTKQLDDPTSCQTVNAPTLPTRPSGLRSGNLLLSSGCHQLAARRKDPTMITSSNPTAVANPLPVPEPVRERETFKQVPSSALAPPLPSPRSVAANAQ